MEDFPIYFYKDIHKLKVDSSDMDTIYVDTPIDEKMRELEKEQDALAKDMPDKIVEEDGELGDEHLMLLPNRVYAFVMKFRQFGEYLYHIYSNVFRTCLCSQVPLKHLSLSMVSESYTPTQMLSEIFSCRMDIRT